MTPKTTGWEELHFAEVPAVESLESLGYTRIPPEAPERGHALGVRRRFPGKTGSATGCQATRVFRSVPFFRDGVLPRTAARDI